MGATDRRHRAFSGNDIGLDYPWLAPGLPHKLRGADGRGV
jgi:hypothetical protein